MGKIKDLTGQRFGRLTVLEKGKSFKDNDGKTRFKWKCECDCGNISFVVPSSLLRGKTKSCGCLQKEIVADIGKLCTTHGSSNSRLYKIWAGMKDRCTNFHSPVYKHYGGRGIYICEEWSNFLNFSQWSIQNGYKDNLSIDRINVNGNYSPDNCRWITQKEQTNNTRKIVLLKSPAKEKQLLNGQKLLT